MTDHDSAIFSRSRVGWIDGARGLSIAAMIVSHVGLVTGLTPWWFHLYVMRPVAPMFLLLLGLLWRPGFRRRHVQFIAGMVAAQVLALTLGFPFPNILLLMGAALLVMPAAMRWPTAVLTLCVCQLAFWPVPDWWTGYQPGFVVAFVLAGQLLPQDGYLRGYGRLGSKLGMEVVGRWPLTFYLGHLLVLVVAVHGQAYWT